MRITIAGMGQMGAVYARNLLEMGSADIFAFDIDPTKVDKARNTFPQLLIGQSLDELPLTDVAVIATNTPSHARVIEELAARGTRYFFCEKPLGLSVEEADRIQAAVEAVDGQVFTAFLINFSPAVERVIELMQAYDLVLVEGMVRWGKNRFGDTRPSAGDTEDESVHGAELLRMLAGVNRTILREQVAGHVSYLDFVDQAAQDRAHELDPSFPLRVDSSTFATLAMETDRGPVHCSLQSSFLLGEQERTVRLLLADARTPRTPRFAIRLDFDVKQGTGVADILQITDLPRKQNLGETPLAANKIRDQLTAFFDAIKSNGEDGRLTPFHRARQAVAFTKAIQASHEAGGMPIRIATQGEILARAAA